VEMYFITIFPDIFEVPLDTGILGIAGKRGAACYHVVNLRNFAEDKYGSVDDYPYGGGPGMILMAPSIVKAVESIRSADEHGEIPVILLSPCGNVLNQAKVVELACSKKIIFI
jgi:tRNA (guanine37-N1)-methyltransferase